MRAATIFPREAEIVAQIAKVKPNALPLDRSKDINSVQKTNTRPNSPIRPPTMTRSRMGSFKKIALKMTLVITIPEKTIATKPLVRVPSAR